MVFVMIVVGGLTRLTQSGLSMVEWRPLMGTLPPLSEQEWIRVFEKYKQYPEYQKVNHWMTLDDFKGIFWFEYAHRLLGRTIGVVFAVPFLYFFIRRAFSRYELLGLFGLFLLGGGQGVIGWWMVKSGMVSRPDVSHYRLMIHLGMAVLLYAALVWFALRFFRREVRKINFQEKKTALFLLGMVLLVFFTILSGALVAGLNAGFQFNTFPLMLGELIPTDLWRLEPWWINCTENLLTVQFDHRLLGTVVLGMSVAAFLWIRRRPLPLSARRALRAMMLMVVVQYGLEVATLLSVVWLPLASLHQVCAVVLLTTVVWTAHEFWRPHV